MSDKVYIYGDSNGATYDSRQPAQATDQCKTCGEPRWHHLNEGPFENFVHGPGSVIIAGHVFNEGRLTHWDPRVEVSSFGHHGVQVGIVPASSTSTDESGIWNSDDGQFLSLDRDGINRLIRALRDARIACYGKDE